MMKQFGEIKTVVLHKLRINLKSSVQSHIIDSASVEQVSDMLADVLSFHLTAFVSAGKWTENYGKTRISVPLTWFDAFRLRFFPKFMTRRFPIAYRVIETSSTTNNYWVFPEVPPNPNKEISDFVMSYYSKGK